MAYAIENNRSGDAGLMPGEEDKYIFLESVMWALSAHVPGEIARSIGQRFAADDGAPVQS